MPHTIPIKLQVDQGASRLRPPGSGTLLCADFGCTTRVRPNGAQLAAFVNGDNELSLAIEGKITGALHQYASERFASQAERMEEIEAKIDLQAEATQRVEHSTAGLVELVNSWAGAMKTIEATGKLLKPLTWIVGFISAVLGLWATARGLKGE
jgi:hypothetical protein